MINKVHRDTAPNNHAPETSVTDDLFGDLQNLQQAIGVSLETTDMRQPVFFEKFRQALMQLEQKTQDHGRFFSYNAKHGRHERMLEAGTVQHHIDQLFCHLEQLENANQ